MRTSSRLRSLAALGMTALIGCASAAPDAKQAPLDEPQIQITQISNIAEAARHVTGAISVQYRVDVENRAKVPITIRRIDVVSLGSGAYNLRSTSVPFSEQLNPGETRPVQFWAPASVDSSTILGANGPVTVRLTLYYDTPAGTQQAIVVQQVQAGG
jgi:hypothetical protein